MGKPQITDDMLEVVIDYFAHQGERAKRYAGYLLDKIERLEEEIAYLHEFGGELQDRKDELLGDNEQLRQENECLKSINESLRLGMKMEE